MVTIKIATENAAFGDSPSGHEIARILARLSSTLKECGEIPELQLFDDNGNPVGLYRDSAA